MRKIFLGFLIFLFSCSTDGVPEGILKPEKMQAVFWDYIRADVYANEYLRLDSTKNVMVESARLQEQVFNLHKVSRQEFYESYEYYLRHQEKLKTVLDTMLVREQQRTLVDTVKKIP